MVDVGINDQVSDGGVMKHSTFGKLLKENSLHIPEPENLPNRTRKLPFAFIADNTFVMPQNVLKPYRKSVLNEEQQIFNYRLCRACHLRD
jgi:hypothetical protein